MRLAALLLAFLLAGCGGRVDARKLVEKQAVATAKVREAKARFASANVRFRASGEKQAMAGATIAKAGEAIKLSILGIVEPVDTTTGPLKIAA